MPAATLLFARLPFHPEPRCKILLRNHGLANRHHHSRNILNPLQPVQWSIAPKYRETFAATLAFQRFHNTVGKVPILF